MKNEADENDMTEDHHAAFGLITKWLLNHMTTMVATHFASSLSFTPQHFGNGILYLIWYQAFGEYGGNICYTWLVSLLFFRALSAWRPLFLLVQTLVCALPCLASLFSRLHLNLQRVVSWAKILSFQFCILQYASCFAEQLRWKVEKTDCIIFSIRLSCGFYDTGWEVDEWARREVLGGAERARANLIASSRTHEIEIFTLQNLESQN